MDANVRNKVDELLKIFSQEDIHMSQADPVAKMMLVALAHQAHQIEQKMESSLSRLSYLFNRRILQPRLLKPQPALSLIQVKNGSQYGPYRVDEKTTFTLKGEKIHYRPLFPVQIIPGRLVCFFADGKLVFDEEAPLPVDATGHEDEIWIAYQAADEVKTLQGFSFMLNAPLLYGPAIRAEVNGISIPVHPVFDRDAFALQTDFETIEAWKQLLVRQDTWLYHFGDYRSEKHVLPSLTPAWLAGKLDVAAAERLNRQRFIWIKLTSGKPVRLPEQPHIRFNCLPVADYDIMLAKLSEAEPLKRLDNEKNQIQYLDVIREPDTMNQFFIRDFDVDQYDNNRIREDITTLYRHFTDDYFAFVEQNGLQDGSRLKNLREAMMRIQEAMQESVQLSPKPFSGTYAIRQPRPNQPPCVVTYLTTHGEAGNSLKAGQLLISSFAGSGETEVLTDAEGGRNKASGATLYQEFARSYALSNERLFTPIDFRQYIRRELIRFFSEEILHHTHIEISTGSRPGERRVEKCIEITINFEQPSMYEKAVHIHFQDYIEIQLKMRAATLYKLYVQIGQV